MKMRMLKALVVVPALLLGLLVTTAAPASAAPGAVVCAVAGTVSVEPGVGRIPPGANNDGGYTFASVQLVCVGADVATAPEMNGIGNADSAGRFGVGNCGGTDVPLIGSFCGDYTSGNFTTGGGCSGRVGGPEAGTDILGGNWSVTFGPVILGGITCTSGSHAGAEGVLALVAVPDPLQIDSKPVGGPTGNCTEPAPLPEDPNAAAVWFCGIVVAGVAVMQSVV